MHIAPEAFAVASAEFADEIQVWQDALPGALKGKLESVSLSLSLALLLTAAFARYAVRKFIILLTYCRRCRLHLD